MRRRIALAILLLSSVSVFADVAVTDHAAVKRLLKKEQSLGYLKLRVEQNQLTPEQRRAANQAKKQQEKANRKSALRKTVRALHPAPVATGSVSLIDSAGLEYFINTNITFSTSSSASAAASEASYT